jgi:ribonucleoside-diphosphate reductase alpha chain
MTRRRLPDRRTNEALTFDHAGVECHTSVGRFEDGSPAEIFLNAGKPGSAVDVLAHDAAVAVSIALQYNVPANEIYDALTKLADGGPASPLGVALKASIRPHLIEE